MAAVETFAGSAMDVDSDVMPAAQASPSMSVGGPDTTVPATSAPPAVAPAFAPAEVPQPPLRGTKSSSPPAGAPLTGATDSLARSVSQPAVSRPQNEPRSAPPPSSAPLLPTQLQPSSSVPHASPNPSSSPAPTAMSSSTARAVPNPPTLEAAITSALSTDTQDIVASIKREVIKRLTAEDIDQFADDILSSASNQFMDRALARRLETIRARDLLNALARAERLGYDADDVIEGGKPDSDAELVIPTSHIAALYPSNVQPPPPHALPAARAPSGPFAPYHPSVKGIWTTPQQPNHAPRAQTSTQTQTATPTPSPGVRPRPSPAVMRPVTGRLPPPIVCCTICNRPCSSYEALTYHNKKSMCNSNPAYQIAGRDICVHCGCQFASPTGILYHTKSKVCGKHSAETERNMLYLLYSYLPPAPAASQQAVPKSSAPAPATAPALAPAPSPAPAYAPSPVPLPRLPVQYQTPAVKAMPGTPYSQRTSTPTIPSSTPASAYDSGPYAMLTPEQRKSFTKEMLESEKFYGELMKTAMLLPPGQSEEELVKLKNRFNTKQSTTRKKYGIRLREKRTATEIEAERARLLGSSGGALAAADGGGPPAKKARVNVNINVNGNGNGRGGAATPQQPTPLPIHESPRKRVPLTEMGGLTGSLATAELVDPTAQARPAEQQRPSPDTARIMHAGTSDDPMQIEDDSGDSTDGDIPARLPASGGAHPAGVPLPG